MGRSATSINLLAFSVAILGQKSYNRKLAHWAKCLHLGVGQMVSECTSSLNGLTGLPVRSKQSLKTQVDQVFQMIASWLQIAMTCPSFNSLAEKYPQRSNNGSQWCKV